MKTTFLKTTVIAAMCLVSLTANAQVVNITRTAALIAGKTMIEAQRQIERIRNSVTTGVAAGARIVGPIIPNTSTGVTITPLPVPNVQMPNTPNITSHFNVYTEGMSLLEKGDTIGAMSCFDKVKDINFMAKGMLGQLQCMQNDKESRIKGNCNLISAFSLGYTPAATFLGKAHKEGLYGYHQDDEIALKWFTLGAERGDSLCIRYRDEYLMKGDTTDGM